MKHTLKTAAHPSSKLLIAAGALALGIALAPAPASAEPAPDAGKRVERSYSKSNDKHYRGRSNDRRYDDRRYDSRSRDRYRGPRYNHRYRGPYRPQYRSQRSYRHERFSIPHRLLRSHLQLLNEFFVGKIYHRSHRHAHMVYDFPTYRDDRVTYQRSAYCRGDLYKEPYREDDYDRLYYDD